MKLNDICKRHFGYKPKDAQRTIIEASLRGKNTMGILPTGYGKCLAAGTKVLMYSGNVKDVSKVLPGDLLMGPDGTPREVISTSVGKGDLYRVSQVNGDSYVTNADHILSLKQTGVKSNPEYPCQQKGKVRNVTVSEWLSSSKNFKHTHKGWRSGPLEFGKRELHPAISPYILGVWLGDGGSNHASVTTADSEILDAWLSWAHSLGMEVQRKLECEGNASTTYFIVSGKNSGRGIRNNEALNALRDLGVLGRKHIPESYMRSTLEDRLNLMAGLLDTDGHLAEAGCFEFSNKNKGMCEDLAWIAKTCGFRTNMLTERKECVNTGVVGTYYRVLISGDVHRIPTRVSRKRAPVRDRKTDWLTHGISVAKCGYGKYYGFHISGDRLFLLADCTVTHNTLCFGLSSLLRDNPTIVFSPLIALMQDQVERFTKAGVPCARVASDMDECDTLSAMRLFKKGMLKLLFVAPERLKNKEFIEACQRVGIGCVCVDEAHVLAVSSRDFRPAYMAIKRFAKLFPNAPIMALTATADPDMEKDIARGLGMATYTRVVGSPRRENLEYKVTSELPIHHVPKLIRNAGEGAKVIYCSSRKSCETVASFLRGQGFRCGHYHAGMEKTERSEAMQSFMDGRTEIVVATNAFGMGVDKADVRLVLHWHVPGSIYDYCQESGRGGRDGKPALCVLNISKEGEKLRNFFMRMANPKQEIYEDLWDYLQQKVSVGDTLKTSEQQLFRVARLPDAVGGQALSAIRFMEYHRLVETVPGIKTYFLNIRNSIVARRFADMNRKQIYIKGSQVIVTVDPTSDSDPVDDMVRAGAVWPGKPRAEILIKRLQRKLTIGKHEIEEKYQHDKDKLFELYRFAAAKDKHQFIDDHFK